jgi:uncharacterized membrane protein YccC
MADAVGQGPLVPDRSAVAGWDVALAKATQAAGPPLLFGLRLWASVCLALFVAFWLQFDNPFWAGTSAAIVCQPQLGASLRKSWFRIIGTAVGATVIVVLTAFFPQDRIAYLGLLAVWGGICAFGATMLPNFASYSAALAGYTAAIIATDNLGATGGASPEVFSVAVVRASEICIGIVCAGIVALTDPGGAERRLAASFADLAGEIAGRFTRMLALAGPQLPDTQTERRALARRVIALDPMIDRALGESGRLRYRAATLQAAVLGLLRALSGWRAVATHLRGLPADADRQHAETILSRIPPELRSAPEPSSPARWLADPLALRHVCEEGVRKLLALPAGTPSLRLLADETAKVLAGMLHVLDGLALLVDAPGYSYHGRRGVRLGMPDRLPALVNAARAFVTIGAAELFWVATAWSHGGGAIVLAAVLVLLFSPKGDRAYGGAVAFALGSAAAVVCAGVIGFAVLPRAVTFPAFCAAIGLVLVPVGFAMTWSRQPAVIGVFSGLGMLFVPTLAPTNPMTYDMVQFFNGALANFAGCALAALSFRLLPPVSPTLQVRRLLALALRDLRRLAINLPPPSSEEWEGRMYGRLAALPDQAEPLQRAQLIAALSVGTDIVQLRRLAPRLAIAAQIDAALGALAQGNGAIAVAQLSQLDQSLASAADGVAETAVALRARARILSLSEALTAHSSYFDSGAPA